MNNMDRINNIEVESADIAPKKSWQKPEISELKTSLTSGLKGSGVGFENSYTSPS